MCDIGRLHTLRRLSLHVTEEEWYDNETPRLPEWLAWEIGRLPNLETLDLWDRPDPGADPELDEWIEARSERGVEVERRTDFSPSFDKRDDWYSGNIRRLKKGSPVPFMYFIEIEMEIALKFNDKLESYISSLQLLDGCFPLCKSYASYGTYKFHCPTFQDRALDVVSPSRDR